MSKSEHLEIAKLAARQKVELDQRLNDALMDTFPCSDPIAIYIPERFAPGDAEREVSPANKRRGETREGPGASWA